ncbi:MAG: hypothetical protein JOZ72_19130 [Alphaproteobacteria bacterium]|nr:hypothetical protein [Alphaproteobacteria bacterium]
MMGNWGTIGRLVAALSVLGLASCSTMQHREPAPVAEPDDSFTCRRAEAKPVKLAALRRDPAAFANRCVVLSLFTNGFDFGETASALHAPLAKGERPMIFHFDPAHPNRPKHPSFVNLVARVRACPADAPQTCLDGIFVSEVHVLPTAMD